MALRTSSLLTLLSAACGCASHAAPRVGPSAAARAVLHELYGLQFVDRAGSTHVITGFAELDNPVSRGGRGPVVLLERGRVTSYLPVEADGDVADLFERVLGTKHESVHGAMSEAYLAATH